MTTKFGPRIEHNGGPCPVAPEAEVKIWVFRHRDALTWEQYGPAGSFDWQHRMGDLASVIAYAVAQPETPAPEPWTPYNNRVPWGLLTDGEKAALKATGGEIQYWCDDQTDGWEPKRTSVFNPTFIYRAVKPPETREVVMHARRDAAGKWWTYENPERPETWPFIFTLTEDANGEPVAIGNLRRKDAAP